MRKAQIYSFFVLFILVSSMARAESVWDRVKPNADVRVRYDQYKITDQSIRTQYRMRGRLGASFQVQDDLSIDFRLVSGSSADGTSTNQTMNLGMAKRAIWFDQLAITYTGLTDSKIVAGKFMNPFYRTGGNQLVFDSDLALEGVFGSHQYKVGDHTLFLNMGFHPLDENNPGNDPMLMAGQLGLKGKMSDVGFTVGGGYYHFDKLQGQNLTSWSRYNVGNTLTGNGSSANPYKYAYKYNNIEGFVDGSFHLMELPTTLFFEYVKNAGVSTEDTGMDVGVHFGKGKEKGQFKLSYDYRVVKADAVVGAFTDSDFANGNTDSKGHTFALRYATSNSTAFVGTYYANKINVSTAQKNYDRVQLDFEAAF